jgi:CRP-like cAMP-binding protein
MSFAPDPRMNGLIGLLPDAEWGRWRQELEPFDMPLGAVLYESGRNLEHVFFPTTAVVSNLYVTENGSSSELSIVGKDGVVGTALFMGGGSALNRAVVLCGGTGYRLSARQLLAEFERSEAVAHLLLRYTQALITQVAQTAVCNRHHQLDKQLCRWLLMLLDRLPTTDIVMTQELIANMLGVRREGVTEAAIRLQKAGVIRYARGHITVLDRLGLLERSCECYDVVRREYERLLLEPAPDRMRIAS